MQGQDKDVSPGPRPGTWSLAVSGIAVVAFVAVLALGWMAASTLFLIFAGILLGVFVSGLTDLLGRLAPVGRGWRLGGVALGLAGLVVGLAAFGGTTVVQQSRDLGQTLQTQAGSLRDRLKGYGIEIPALPGATPKDGGSEAGKEAPKEAPKEQPEDAPKEASTEASKADGRPPGEPKPDGMAKPGGMAKAASGLIRNPGSILSDAGSVLGPAASVILGLFAALGNVLVIVFLGLAFAADPETYRDGTLRFLPPRHRERGAKVLDGMGETLRHWLFGQLIIMAVIFACTWAGLGLLGIGGSLILGLQAGLLAFVPTVGPLVAGIVIILGSLASGPSAALGAFGVYVAVQTLESYGLTPFIQKRALDIPPATIFGGQLLLGVVFGLWGIALALPLMAVGKVLLEQLYIEDTLHEDPGM